MLDAPCREELNLYGKPTAIKLRKIKPQRTQRKVNNITSVSSAVHIRIVTGHSLT
jgi:hypothetical protein